MCFIALCMKLVNFLFLQQSLNFCTKYFELLIYKCKQQTIYIYIFFFLYYAKLIIHCLAFSLKVASYFSVGI